MMREMRQAIDIPAIEKQVALFLLNVSSDVVTEDRLMETLRKRFKGLSLLIPDQEKRIPWVVTILRNWTHMGLISASEDEQGSVSFRVNTVRLKQYFEATFR
jgi:hypothetical protein